MRLPRTRLLALLDLPASADAAAIKVRYRMLAKAHHPDLNPDCETSAERFAQITDAYQRLMGDGGERDSDGADGAPAAYKQGPAMQARWNIRRKSQPREYPEWFTPEDPPKAGG